MGEPRQARAHNWAFVFSTGADAPGRSLDTISQCKQCGALQHDYRHNVGETAPGYPRIFKFGAAIDRDSPCLGLLGEARSSVDATEKGGSGG